MKIGYFGNRDDNHASRPQASPAPRQDPGFAGTAAPSTAADPAMLRFAPPPLPPSLQRELERIANHQFQTPQQGTPALSRTDAQQSQPSSAALVYTGGLDGGILNAIHACRDGVEQVLMEETKEYQILKMLHETDLGVCSELASELRQRLAGHAVFQIVSKLDEAYTLALRYQKPKPGQP